ncbi:MAG: amidohydrolase [Gammaproteobacteria bacterium]
MRPNSTLWQITYRPADSIFIAACLLLVSMIAPSISADLLYANITGYRYVEGEPPENTPLQHRALAPREGYWTSFNAMRINDEGRIVKTYSIEDQKPSASTELTVVDGQGRTVLPGLIDAHGHILGLGQTYQRVDLMGTESVQAAQQLVATFAEMQPEQEWILGRGWNQVLWPDKQFPTASDLDEIEAKKPVFLRRIDGHAGWANSAALKKAGITALTRDPSGGQILRDADGVPTGVLVDKAMDMVERNIPPPSMASVVEALGFAQKELAQMGITSAHDAGVNAELAKLYRKMAANDQLSVRVYGMVSGAGPELTEVGAPWPADERDMFLLRSVKLYADGALGSRGAAMIEPYSDQKDSRGLLFSPFDELELQVRRAADLGFQVNVHAIGDAANRQVLDIFARLPLRRHKLRHRIEHAQIIAMDDLVKFQKHEVIASMQPTHATSDMNMAEDRIGSERVKGAYAWRKILDLGVVIAAGSDFPVELSNPFHGLYSAVSRKDHKGNPDGGWYPEENLTRGEALKAFTVDAAFSAHQETKIGNLEQGKWADFIVLEEDFFKLPEADIWKMQVHETWVGGKRVYTAVDEQKAADKKAAK